MKTRGQTYSQPIFGWNDDSIQNSQNYMEATRLHLKCVSRQSSLIEKKRKLELRLIGKKFFVCFCQQHHYRQHKTTEVKQFNK